MTEKDFHSDPPSSSKTTIHPICPLSLQPLPIHSNPRNVALIFDSLYPTKSNDFWCSSRTNEIENENKNENENENKNNSKTSIGPCQCTLIPLIHYLYDSSAKKSNLSSQFICPVCQSQTVVSIFDYKAFQLVQSELEARKIVRKEINSIHDDDDASSWRVVAFRYGKQHYYLSIHDENYDTNESNANNDSNLAQDWIAHILGMEAELTMKVS